MAGTQGRETAAGRGPSPNHFRSYHSLSLGTASLPTAADRHTHSCCTLTHTHTYLCRCAGTPSSRLLHC